MTLRCADILRRSMMTTCTTWWTSPSNADWYSTVTSVSSRSLTYYSSKQSTSRSSQSLSYQVSWSTQQQDTDAGAPRNSELHVTIRTKIVRPHNTTTWPTQEAGELWMDYISQRRIQQGLRRDLWRNYTSFLWPKEDNSHTSRRIISWTRGSTCPGWQACCVRVKVADSCWTTLLNIERELLAMVFGCVNVYTHMSTGRNLPSRVITSS